MKLNSAKCGKIRVFTKGFLKKPKHLILESQNLLLKYYFEYEQQQVGCPFFQFRMWLCLSRRRLRAWAVSVGQHQADKEPQQSGGLAGWQLKTLGMRWSKMKRPHWDTVILEQMFTTTLYKYLCTKLIKLYALFNNPLDWFNNPCHWFYNLYFITSCTDWKSFFKVYSSRRQCYA